jgi:leucyl aminopeptidase (aminopeptidase T)
VDNKKVQEITDSVFRLVSGCKHARISGENGTSVTASFDKKYRWISLGSIVQGRGWTNLPGAEIMTYPATINGVYVVDGVLGDHFVRYGTLEKSPVHIKISDGKAVSISCDNNDLERELTEYIGKDKNGARIGEFALGTNIFLKKFSGILLQDEKFPTVHIALGNPYPKLTGAPYDAKTHVDAVTRNVSVWVDGRKIMEEGTYLI